MRAGTAALDVNHEQSSLLSGGSVSALNEPLGTGSGALQPAQTALGPKT